VVSTASPTMKYTSPLYASSRSSRPHMSDGFKNGNDKVSRRVALASFVQAISVAAALASRGHANAVTTGPSGGWSTGFAREKIPKSTDEVENENQREQIRATKDYQNDERGEEAKKMLDDAQRSVRDSTGQSADMARGKANEVFDSGQRNFNQGTEDVSGRFENAKNKAGDALDKSKSKANRDTDKVGGKVDELKNKGSDALYDTKQRSQSAMGDTKRRASETGDAVKDQASGVFGKTKEKFQEGKDKAGDAFEKTRDKVKDNVDAGKKKISNVFNDNDKNA